MNDFVKLFLQIFVGLVVGTTIFGTVVMVATLAIVSLIALILHSIN